LSGWQARSSPPCGPTFSTQPSACLVRPPSRVSAQSPTAPINTTSGWFITNENAPAPSAGAPDIEISAPSHLGRDGRPRWIQGRCDSRASRGIPLLASRSSSSRGVTGLRGRGGIALGEAACGELILSSRRMAWRSADSQRSQRSRSRSAATSSPPQARTGRTTSTCQAFQYPVGVADLLDGAPAVTPIGLGPDVTRLEAHEPQISGLGSATVHTAALQHKGAACAKASSGGSGTRQYQGTVTAWANPPSDMNANGPRRPRTGAAVPPGTSGSGGRTGSSTRPPARPVRCLRRRCPPRRPRRRPRDPAPSESWPAGTGRPESAARCRRHRYNQKEDPQPQAEVNLLHERDTRAWCSTHNSSCRLGKPAGQPVTVKVADATLPLRRPLAWKVSFLPG
jgi:hypothetical protein